MNLEIHVGLCIPKSVPYTEMTASLSSRRVGSVRGPDVRLGHHDPDGATVRVDHLAVADLILPPAQGMRALVIVADAQLRLLGHLDLGDQIAPRRIPPRELDTGRLTDQAPSAIAAHEIPRPHRLATRQPDINPRVVLSEPRHLTPIADVHRQLGDPLGHDPLDLVLPDPKRIRMTRREVAHVQPRRAEARSLNHLTLGKEPISDATLIEHLDRARVKTARSRADQHMIGTTLEERDIDPRQRQLSRQHHACRTTSSDHHGMLGLRHASAVYVDSSTHFVPPISMVSSCARRSCGRALPAGARNRWRERRGRAGPAGTVHVRLSG